MYCAVFQLEDFLIVSDGQIGKHCSCQLRDVFRVNVALGLDIHFAEYLGKIPGRKRSGREDGAGRFRLLLLDACKTSNYSEPGNIKVVNPNQP